MHWKATAESDEMYSRLGDILRKYGQRAIFDEPRRAASFSTRDDQLLADIVEAGCRVESEDE